MSTLEKIKILSTALTYPVVEESLCVTLNNRSDAEELSEVAEIFHTVLNTGVCYDVFTIACFNQMYKHLGMSLKYKTSADKTLGTKHRMISSTRWELVYTKNNSSMVVMDRTISIVKHV
jgi:hypothetical protein